MLLQYLVKCQCQNTSDNLKEAGLYVINDKLHVLQGSVARRLRCGGISNCQRRVNFYFEIGEYLARDQPKFGFDFGAEIDRWCSFGAVSVTVNNRCTFGFRPQLLHKKRWKVETGGPQPSPSFTITTVVYWAFMGTVSDGLKFLEQRQIT